MKLLYRVEDGRLQQTETIPPDEAVWIDLLEPSAEEEADVERAIGICISAKAPMTDIEDSARLYEQDDAAIMTVVVAAGMSDERPVRTQLTFILTDRQLVSLRSADPQALQAAKRFCTGSTTAAHSPEALLLSLLAGLVAATADAIEEIGRDLAGVSEALFLHGDGRRSARRNEIQLQVIMRRLGRRNMAVSILRESLRSFERLTFFFRQRLAKRGDAALSDMLRRLDRDIHSLASHEEQLALEITYLHDATLGLINLEQTRIIKAFSIAAVLFLPATLVGTVYGMNFKSIPELEWAYGYPFALGLMLVSAIIPYVWLRRKGWL